MPVKPEAAGRPGPVCSVGVDIVDTRDVSAAITERGDAYVQRVFTPAEARFCRAGHDPEAIAGRFAEHFAAKEAVFKALSWGGDAASWHGIEVAKDPSGAWRTTLRGAVHAAALAAGIARLTLSVSRTAGVATAVVTATRARASHTE